MKKCTILSMAIAMLFCAKSQTPCNDNMATTSAILEGLSKRPVNIEFTSLIESCNVNDSVKKRILELLNWRWTESEIGNYLESYFVERESFRQVKKCTSYF